MAHPRERKVWRRDVRVLPGLANSSPAEIPPERYDRSVTLEENVFGQKKPTLLLYTRVPAQDKCAS
jgi:hypothetical protein